MARLRKCLWMLAAIMTVPAPAIAGDICSTLDRIAAAARERPAFASLGRALAEDEAVVPGFWPRDCRVSPGGIDCDDISFNTRNFDGWPNPLTCRGLTAVPPTGPRPGQERQFAYLLSGLRIEYGFSCRGCAGGSHGYFHAAFEPGLPE